MSPVILAKRYAIIVYDPYYQGFGFHNMSQGKIIGQSFGYIGRLGPLWAINPE